MFRYLLTPALMLAWTLTSDCVAQVAVQQAANDAPPAARLQNITDYDAANQITEVRARFEFDTTGRRIANQVFDAQERWLATERFQYDRQGRLTQRDHIGSDKELKWRWTKFRHDAEGRPTRNDIVNRKGKKIGWYTWRYDHDGRLSRRDRFNADGSRRFYFADIQFDDRGEFSIWSKYDADGKKIGIKTWKYGL